MDTAELKGRVALVTGGGRGIGQAISLALAASGATVAVNWARDEQSALNTVEEIRGHGGSAMTTQARVDDAAQVSTMVDHVVGELGPISILVHNGGIASKGYPVADTDADEVEQLLRIQAVGPHQLTRLVLPGMRSCERGDVVMVSSSATHAMLAYGAPYSMAKAALEALAYTLAKEEIAHNIHVNIVAPGLVKSDMGDRLAKAITAGAAAEAVELDSTSPWGHVCRPSEVADVVSYLVSTRASYLTAQRIVVDGGTHPHRP